MRLLSCVLLGAALVAADQPAVAPKYEPQAQASQSAPVYAAPAPAYNAPAPAPAYEAPQAAPTYSAPQAAPAPAYNAPAPAYEAPQAAAPTYNAPQAAAPDTYGSPAADPVASNDDYGAPQAQPIGINRIFKLYYNIFKNSMDCLLQAVTVMAPPRPPQLVTRDIITTTTQSGRTARPLPPRSLMTVCSVPFSEAASSPPSSARSLSW